MCGSNLVASQLLLVCATPPPAATIVPSLVVSSSIMLLTSPTPLVDSGHVLNNPTTPSCVSGCKMYPLHTSGKWVTYLIACFHNAFSLFCLYCLAEITSPDNTIFVSVLDNGTQSIPSPYCCSAICQAYKATEKRQGLLSGYVGPLDKLLRTTDLQERK